MFIKYSVQRNSAQNKYDNFTNTNTIKRHSRSTGLKANFQVQMHPVNGIG